MKYVFEEQDFPTLAQAQSHCWLLTNGLGGYASASAAFSVTRCDQGLLIGAVEAPNRRMSLVHRLSEELTLGSRAAHLSTQVFADGQPPEEGYRFLSRFTLDAWPEWVYDVGSVRVHRRVGMRHGDNAVAVLYDIDNHADVPCALRVKPLFQFTPKGEALQKRQRMRWEPGRVSANGQTVHLRANGQLTPTPTVWETLAYPDDAKDGRAEKGLAGSCCVAEITVAAGKSARLELIFSMASGDLSGEAILADMAHRQQTLLDAAGLTDPIARQLVLSADAFLSRRDSTGGHTVIAGYPFFADWGRDTMIALPGCVLATRQYDIARSILRTFLRYEQDGLVPNLFPEGASEPLYNTVDAALLLINGVWLYHERTGDDDFVREAWPVMTRIVEAYRRGTHHAIGMDEDGLIHAGEGLDQVTWMDVRIGDILPTPRHGKPVEINAYWYNALCVLRELAPLAGVSGDPYGRLAEQVKASFARAFWMEEKGYLRDVISGTKADEQLRCNQIWAVSMPFTMLTRAQEKRVVETVARHLYTPWGLRTLSPEDPEFHPFYGGPQRERDMAYHQGTVWPFPMGAFHLAYLKVHDRAPEAVQEVRRRLEGMDAILREGCVGQLPEIYDGGQPGESKGCFAQAWSVGELLRVYEALERRG